MPVSGAFYLLQVGKFLSSFHQIIDSNGIFLLDAIGLAYNSIVSRFKFVLVSCSVIELFGLMKVV